jgi:hypothetical protein
MRQRVNIQYSVELDDLQHEVNRLFCNAISELNKASPTDDTHIVKLGTDGLEKIDSIRQHLAKIDIMLGDVQNILEGYVSFKTTPPPQQKEAPPTPPQEADLLQEQLDKFKELIDANSDQES